MTEQQNSRDIEALRLEIREHMVRKGEYDLQQKAVAKDIAENAKDIVTVDAKLEKSEERRAADRRLILTALILPLLIALITIYVTSRIGAS